ncbi:nuclear transport factor 2 family protein [Phaeodactylibacter sp.]|jgi:predicted SnoaL-like aldol condensation-catalyzing enzyme|uniref:nuclear transport factor 2 family protein n=1 Tax=Phaeodactylibacter sp. TaxID=1940289 RepID=UPI0025EAD8C4|nr:nuclear transport factor 2 family protein [Phaeodactylibacter sp.]MCI4650937.1 nuclear transport factor 2 family protein [Phaeodactylibacter sp.]MCI5092724.1 nuclear transport factor 2 family protein [Phaeodactylibacter sp.]
MKILNLKTIVALFILTAFFASCDKDDDLTPELTQREKITAFFEAVNTRDVTTIEELVTEDYIQHNPFIPTGRDPFVGLLTTVLEDNGTKVENIRILEEGNFVAIHNLWTNAAPFGADTVVSFDILRFDENGKIAEHWDAIQPWESQTANGNTMVDGPTNITNLDETEANKALAISIIEDVLMGQNPNNIINYIAEDYVQHNPGIDNGLVGIQAAVDYLISINNMFQYNTIHKVIGEGNFVLTISEGTWNGTSNAFYDLFRMENGKAVEHWDIIQPVPTEGLANDNGMFGGF